MLLVEILDSAGAMASQNLYSQQVIDVSGPDKIHPCYEFLLLVNAIDGPEPHFPW